MRLGWLMGTFFGGVVLGGLLEWTGPALGAAESGSGAGAMASRKMLQVTGVIHVHTRMSTGQASLEETLSAARKNGVEAILLAENYLLRYEYGLYPWRNLIRRRMEWPSILRLGPDRFLEGVGQAQRNFPEVILIPGIEVAPYHFWTGSLPQGDLTLHDTQKNLLVIGLERAQDYLQLPALGNRAVVRYDAARGIRAVVEGLMLIGGITLFFFRRKRRVQVGPFVTSQVKTYRLPGAVMVAMASFSLVDNFPFQSPRFDPYRDNPGILPYQELIDYANGRGGVSIWSFPEARDFHRFDYGPLGKVTVKTDPYPLDLFQSHDYTAFGAIYADNTPLIDPGGGWDGLLQAYCAGRRARPAWGIGEAGLHFEGQAGKRMIDVETIFLVPRRGKREVLQALKRGEMYALRRDASYGLVLEDFRVAQGGGASPRVALAGEEIEIVEGKPWEIQFSIATTRRKAVPLEVKLIRSGKVVQALRVLTPYRGSLRDRFLPGTGRDYYRLDVLGESPHRLLSNPIFVSYSERAHTSDRRHPSTPIPPLAGLH